MKKIQKKIYKLMFVGITLFLSGLALALFMYFSTFMPGNPFRKIFYVAALFLLGKGFAFIFEASEKQRRLNATLEKALAAYRRQR